MKSSRVAGAIAGAAAMLLAALPVAGQQSAARNYPVKPIRVIVGYVAGGGNDIIARVVSGKMSEGLGQPVVIENKPGAQSIIAAVYVAKAEPDGYTILMGATGPMAMNPATHAKLPYDPLRDFVPISMIGSFPLLLVTNPSLPVRSVKELIEFAKAKPKEVFYGASAAPFQLAAELLNQKAGTSFTYVPYKGSNESVNAVAAGQVTITISDPPPAIGPLKGGRLRALAVTSAARHPTWPDLPTLAESGLPDLEVALWTGFFLPAATPPGIVTRLQEEVARVVRLPEIRERLAAMGVDAVGNSSEEFRRVVASDIAKWTAVAKAANIKAN